MKRSFALSCLVALALVSSGFADKKETRQPLQRVETQKVCMINEHVFEKDQIPVVVEGRTYYGCCEMCKKALAENADKREAIDPVSGKKVDKAVAVIAADSEGKVFYFENEENLKKYNGK